MSVSAIASSPICHEGITWHPFVDDRDWYTRHVLRARIENLSLEIAHGQKRESEDEPYQECWFVSQCDITGGKHTDHSSLEEAMSSGNAWLKERLEEDIVKWRKQADEAEKVLKSLKDLL